MRLWIRGGNESWHRQNTVKRRNNIGNFRIYLYLLGKGSAVEIFWKTSGRYTNRKRKFFILFSCRYLYNFKRNYYCNTKDNFKVQVNMQTYSLRKTLTLINYIKENFKWQLIMFLFLCFIVDRIFVPVIIVEFSKNQCDGETKVT